MFERYTEKARRTIFFGRFEASQFDTGFIETEHLLLALLREDTALVNRLLTSHADVESIRKQIEAHTAPRQKVATSVDLPFSYECKRVLAYGAEEAERLNHKHIGTEHLLLGLLREENCFAAQLLRQQGLSLQSVREQVQQPEHQVAERRTPSSARLDHWLAECQARGGIRTVRQERVANRTTQFAIYAVEQPNESEMDQHMGPAERVANIQKRIDFNVSEMERAIANHEFEKARLYSDEERRQRNSLRVLREQFNLEEPPPRVPPMCIEVISDDERFSDIQKRCDDYIAEGVTTVWLLDPESQHVYTVTEAEGLREFRGRILKAVDLPLQLDVRSILG
jgi:Uma2 family endonuclease